MFPEIEKMLAKGKLDLRRRCDRDTAFMRLEVVISQRFSGLRLEISQAAAKLRQEIVI